jgi:hypothetical protein
MLELRHRVAATTMNKPEALTQLLLISGAISRLPEAERDAVRAAAKEIRALADKHGEAGVLALALTVAEITAGVEPPAKE